MLRQVTVASGDVGHLGFITSRQTRSLNVGEDVVQTLTMTRRVDNFVNCQFALEVGYAILDQSDSKTYGMPTLNKCDRVTTMSVLTNASSDVKLKVQDRFK